MQTYKLVVYRTVMGKEPFTIWLQALRDEKAKAVIGCRLKRIIDGNLGEIRNVGGGVSELKIDLGPGYRVYFSYASRDKIIIFLGGSKGSQTQDIITSQFYREDYFRRKK